MRKAVNQAIFQAFFLKKLGVDFIKKVKLVLQKYFKAALQKKA
jgi:hypothetical protein